MDFDLKPDLNLVQDDIEAEADDLDTGFSIDFNHDAFAGLANIRKVNAARRALRAHQLTASTNTLEERIARQRALLARETGDAQLTFDSSDSEMDELVDMDSESDQEADSDAQDLLTAAETTKVHVSGANVHNEDDEDDSDDDEDMVTKRSFLADGMSSADEESEVESESEPESGSESEAESEVESMAGASDTESDEEIDEAEEARRQEYFDIEENVDKSLPQSFNLMNLSRPILKGLAQLGFTKPTPIQARAIPIALLGKDICGGAVTGSGKTAAFFVPILERLLYRPRKNPAIRVLVLCPTRELAIQCHSVATKLAAFTDVNMCLCVGGLPMRAQETELRQRPDIVIATPGRLIDHLHNSRSFTVETLEILVMDEADRMLEDGFKAELTEIVENCPRSRQTMLFSATMTQNIDELIRLSLHKPALVQIDSAKQAAANLVQEFIRIRPNREADRPAVLLSLCRKTYKRRCIIFFRSKLAVREMKILFGLCGLSAAEIHGNLNQAQRSEALERFRDGEVEFLMATDVAARGLDIKGVETVINFNMPMQFAQYLHRVGRTARAGQSGRSVTLAGESDRKLLRLALKTAKKDRVRSRIIAPATIEKYKAKLETLKPQVEKILADDDDDQLLVKAEKDINRASNLIKYAEEIKARPAKAWFQSTAEKRQEKAKEREFFNAKLEANLTSSSKATKPSQMTHAKKRKLKSNDDKAAERSAWGSIKAAKRANKMPRISALDEGTSRPKGPNNKAKNKKKKGAAKGDFGFANELTSTTKKGAGQSGAAAKKKKSMSMLGAAKRKGKVVKQQGRKK